MHEHNECQHELKYCEHCDVAYCRKCKREWGKTIYVTTYPYYSGTWTFPNMYVNPNVPYTITCGSDSTSTFHIHS